MKMDAIRDGISILCFSRHSNGTHTLIYIHAHTEIHTHAGRHTHTHICLCAHTPQQQELPVRPGTRLKGAEQKPCPHPVSDASEEEQDHMPWKTETGTRNQKEQ